MGKWLRQLFCKHRCAIGEFLDVEKKYIFRCKKCGKEIWGNRK